MLETTTISTKGQLTIPAHIREQLQLHPGDKMRFLVDDDGSLILFPVRGRIEDAYGILPKPQKTVTIEEMDRAVGEAVSARVLGHDRN